MPLFKYKVADTNGRVQEILIEGDNQTDATRRVRVRGLIPIESLGPSDSSGGGEPLRWGFRKSFDVADFTDRLVPLLQAEIPLERALAIVEETGESREEREIISNLRRGLHEGRKFSQLIRDRGRMFPKMYASIVEAGEEAGALPQVLGQLRDFLNMTRDMKAFLISSSIYPLFVIVVCIGVISLLLGIVVPRFARVIMSTGRKPSFSTQLLLDFSDLIRSYWWLALVAAGVALFFARQVRDEGKVKEFWDDLVLKLPFLGKIVILANIGRQVRTMSILMKSGVHLLDTVSISAKVLQNGKLRDSISGLAAELRRGERLSSALSRSPYIPPLVVRMLAVGEETGASDQMLERVADRYDAELRHIIKRALSWFEPLVIICLGGIVGTIVLLLFLAVLDIQTSF